MKLEDFDKVKGIIEQRKALKAVDEHLAQLLARPPAPSITRVQIGVVTLNLHRATCDRMITVMREEIARSIAVLDCDLCGLDVDVAEEG
jgi:hypothetical protein